MPRSIWFRLLLALVLSLTVVLVTALVVGNRLPEEFRASGKVHVALTPDALWARLADFESSPRSALSTSKVTRLSEAPELPRWSEQLSESTITWEATEWTAPTRMVARGQDSVVPLTTEWVFELTPEGEGTLLMIDNVTRVADGSWHVPLFRLALKYGGTRVAIASYLQNALPGFDPKSIEWSSGGS